MHEDGEGTVEPEHHPDDDNESFDAVSYASDSLLRTAVRAAAERYDIVDFGV